MRVAITGASGLVGSALVPFLRNDGHDVVRLVRRALRAADEAHWDPAAGMIDAAGLEGVDAAVNLSGENLAGGRWTEARKARLRASRLGPTRLLAETLARRKAKPRVLVSVSAVGYYGDRGDTWLTEAEPPAGDFLGRLTAEWEGTGHERRVHEDPRPGARPSHRRCRAHLRAAPRLRRDGRGHGALQHSRAGRQAPRERLSLPLPGARGRSAPRPPSRGGPAMTSTERSPT